MAVYFWYLVIVINPVYVTFSKVPEQHGHVYLVGLFRGGPGVILLSAIAVSDEIIVPEAKNLLVLFRRRKP